MWSLKPIWCKEITDSQILFLTFTYILWHTNEINTCRKYCAFSMFWSPQLRGTSPLLPQTSSEKAEVRIDILLPEWCLQRLQFRKRRPEVTSLCEQKQSSSVALKGRRKETPQPPVSLCEGAWARTKLCDPVSGVWVLDIKLCCCVVCFSLLVLCHLL